MPLVEFLSNVSDLHSYLHSQAHHLISFLPAELFKAMENAVPRIVELLGDSKFRVRCSAMTVLGEISKQCK